MKTNTIDTRLMADIKERARQLRSQYAQRDLMMESYDEMYLLNWTRKNEEKLQHMQVTASTDFRTAVNGAVRLMVATDPLINVVENEASKSIDTTKVEQFLQSILHHSGRIAGEPVHYPLITTGILYDEMHAAITSTADMLAYAKSARPVSDADRLYKKANIARWEEINSQTAWLIEPFNPRYGYPEFGSTGLTAYYRIVETTVGKVLDQFGQLPEKLSEASRSTPVYLHTFYDNVYTAIWLDGGDILLKPHGLPRIPIAVQILNGSRVFKNPEDQRQPMGYALAKANLWNAQSLMLTVMMTAVLNMGATPTKVYTPQAEGSRIDIDYDEDVLRLHPGDRLDFVLNKGLIDPALAQLWQITQGKVQESTIYPQALGQAVERQGTTYSELALLSQSGRLPLIGPQRRGGWGFSGIFETILAFMRADPRYRSGTGLAAADLAKGIEIETKLDVALPQDKLQQANIFNVLTSGDYPKVSDAWGLEHILNINDPAKMKQEIWNERAAWELYRQTLAQLMQQAQQPPPPQPGQPGGPMPGAALPNGAAPVPAGAQMQGGLPQAQAGLVPGPGGPALTPEQLGGQGGPGGGYANQP